MHDIFTILKQPGDYFIFPYTNANNAIVYMALDKTIKKTDECHYIRRVIDCIKVEQERLDRMAEVYFGYDSEKDKLWIDHLKSGGMIDRIYAGVLEKKMCERCCKRHSI